MNEEELLETMVQRLGVEVKRLYSQVKHGRVSAATVVRRNVEYFRTNRERMRYDQYRRWRLPIGTGAVEGSCKFVVQSRFKRPA